MTALEDEEFESLGTRDLVARGIRAEAALVTEPTRLAIMPAHKGFVWVDVTVHGRAAHGSRWDLGVDAIRNAGLLLAELDDFDSETLPTRMHPLLGRPSLHASLISGGRGMSTYPDRCELRLERRTIPGESPGQVLGEIEAACERVRRKRSDFLADIALSIAQNPSDVATDAPVCRALRYALEGEGIDPRVEGMSAWTDAAILNDAGIPAVCFGPGDIALAHADEEFVVVEEIRLATAVMTRLARALGTGGTERMAQLTHQQYDILEDAIRRGTRIVTYRRGTEFIVIPLALKTEKGREAVAARNPTTGDALTLFLDELDAIAVVR